MFSLAKGISETGYHVCFLFVIRTFKRLLQKDAMLPNAYIFKLKK